MTMTLVRRATLYVAFALSASCVDPVHDDAVAALGDEASDVPQGALHRPGQPCATCHGDEGPAKLRLAIGGTILLTKDNAAPAAGVTVTMTDASGARRALVTNDAGNFFLAADAYAPIYPLHVEVARGEEAASMLTRIGRENSCASCHTGQGNRTKVPAVYLRSL